MPRSGVLICDKEFRCLSIFNLTRPPPFGVTRGAYVQGKLSPGLQHLSTILDHSSWNISCVFDFRRFHRSNRLVLLEPRQIRLFSSQFEQRRRIQDCQIHASLLPPSNLSPLSSDCEDFQIRLILECARTWPWCGPSQWETWARLRMTKKGVMCPG
jgi:hypothetical protein